MRKWVLFTVMMMAASVELFAQSFKDRVAEVKAGYEDMKNVHIVMSIEVFDDDKSNKPFYAERAIIKKHDDNFHYRFGSKDMLMNGKYTIVVDRETKEIVLNNRDVLSEKRFADPIKLNMDSILNQYEEPLLISLKGSIEHYRITPKKGQLKQIDIHIDINEKIMKQVEYHYDSKQYVNIQFLTFNKNVIYSDDTFSEKVYVLIDGGKAKPASAYGGFRVVTAAQ